MIRNYQTVTALPIVLMLIWSAIVPALGQGGTGRVPTTPPKKSTPRKAAPPARKTTPPKGNAPAPLQLPCSAQSPTVGTGRGRTVNLNGVRLELVEIPLGSFCMGSTTGGIDERPVHQVTISQVFYLGKYEVTQAQWQAVMGTNPSYEKGCGSCPVEQVTWNDAQAFIDKMNAANDDFTYRLPSEAEWEYACRAGTTGDYYAANLEDIGWYYDYPRLERKPRIVGGKQPNIFGLYDMSGNVSEWCRDLYNPNYDGAPTDGSAWISGEEMKRVTRGGNFHAAVVLLRSATRLPLALDYRAAIVGFRVAAVARNK